MLSASCGHDTRKVNFLVQPHSTLNAPSAQEPQTKTCTKCGEIKPATAEYFRAKKRGKYGVASQCRICEASYARSWNHANKERAAENRRVWRDANRDKIAEYNEVNKERISAWREAHREQQNAYGRAYYKANRDRLVAYRRAYVQANKERIVEYYTLNKEKIEERHRAYREANKQRRHEAQRKWRMSNRAVISAKQQRRRALNANAEGSHSAQDIADQYKRQKGKCYWCNEKVGDNWHNDHVIPLSRGGSNWPENIVIACPSCNLSKNNKLPHEWIQGGRLL